MSAEPYIFPELPLGGIGPGTSVLVAGPSHAGTRELGLRLLAGPPGEGAIVVTTNRRAARIADDCERAGITVSPDRTAILDCVGGADPNVPARLLTVSSPSDLTGIGMRFSDVYLGFKRDGIERVRTGLSSVSTLLSFGDLPTVSRFVHTLVGRIDTVDGLGVFVIDPDTHDERAVSTIAQFCSGRIDVRRTADGPELRAGGLPGQPAGWQRFDTA